MVETVSQKLFLSALTVLILFNAIFYISGYNDALFSLESLINIFVLVGVTVVVISIIPFLGGENTVMWFAKTIIIVGFLYQVRFNVMGYNFPVGVGLVSNLTGMFSESIEELSFMPWIFFHLIGVIGLIGGLTMDTGD